MSVFVHVVAVIGALQAAVIVTMLALVALAEHRHRRDLRRPVEPARPLTLVALTWVADIPVYQIRSGDDLDVALWLHHARDEGTVRNAC